MIIIYIRERKKKERKRPYREKKVQRGMKREMRGREMEGPLWGFDKKSTKREEKSKREAATPTLSLNLFIFS